MNTVQALSPQQREAPGPRRWPLIGNVGALRGVIPFMESQWAAHGDVFRVRVFGLNGLVIANPEHIQRVLLTNRQNYIKGSAYDTTRKILGDGLVTLEGDAWKGRRALAQPAFHRQALDKLTGIMIESGARYFDAMKARITTGDGEIDAHEEMVKLTLDVVINALFGAGTLDSTDISYDALGAALELLSTGANGLQLPGWIPTPHNLKFRRTVQALDRNVYQIIAAGKKLNGSNGSLLSMLLDARDADGAPLSDKAVRDEIITLFLAGHETTALTLTWLFVLLDDRPEIVQRMRAEVDAVLDGRDPTFQDIAKLTYLRQVVDETLRVRPPAPMVARNALAEDLIGGFQVRRGDVVLPFIWGAHRHPDHWKAPDKFDPERFSAEASRGRSSWSYLPFSGGPRICIGNMFSLIETVVLLAQLFNRFDIEVRSCAEVAPVAIGTVRPSKPVRVKFTPRSVGRRGVP